MSSRDKRKDSDADDRIEDAVVVSETATDEAGVPRDPGEAPLVAPADAPADPNPGDGSNFHDRGSVAVDLRADALAQGGADPVTEGTGAPEPEAPGLSDTPPDLDGPPEPEAVQPAPPPPPQPAPQKSGGGFWGPVLGGIVAAGVGFGVSEYLNSRAPEGPDPVLEALSALESQTEAQQAAAQERLDALDGQLSQIATAVAERDTDAVESRLEQLSSGLGETLDALTGRFESVTSGIGGLEQTLAGVQERLGTVTERLQAVEARPLTESSETARTMTQQYESQIEQLRASLDEEKARVESLAADLQAANDEAQSRIESVQSQASDVQAQAQQAADRAATREAVARIAGALDRGTPYAEALAALPESVSVPEALSANAEDGVATLPQLRLSLPEHARAALDASIRETVADDPTGRIVAFLRSQTGARSLAPKEGEDPDAVLSRAEALAAEGDLVAAIAELELLPPAGQAEVADWISRAETRIAVTAALAELADTTTGE